MAMKILIIDDEESMRHMLSVMLRGAGYETTAFAEAERALEAISDGGFDFVLCDIRMPGMDGMGFLRALAERGAEQTVIMMSAYGTIDTAVECMKLGAYDYISKPFKTDEIILTLRKAEERERLKRENTRLMAERMAEYDFRHIYTEDPAMQGVLEMVRKVADYSTSVLITGESGTGKELVARAIHYSGSRAKGPFVVVNCGAIPGALLESELFGHAKGAFTDAHRAKTGMFEEADGGTIFLDEVGELPTGLQVKLLRVLQEGEVRRVGDTRPVNVDTRVVAATNKDLPECIRDGSFREDLYYRLNVMELRLPPLRARPGDVPGLARLFAEKYATRFGRECPRFSVKAMEALSMYSWPGNVRELENVVERALIVEDGPELTAASLPDLGRERGGDGKGFGVDTGFSIKRAHEATERVLISRALERTGGNRTRAAELLEISLRALLYKIKNYGL